MRIVAILAGSLLTLAALAFALLFTPPGNALLRPVIETRINASLPLESSLERFELGWNRFDIMLRITPSNTFEAEGSYSLLSQSVEALYRLHAQALEELSSLTPTPLRGAFSLEGSVSGDMDALRVTGESDLAGGETRFETLLEQLEPASLKAKASGLRAELLQQMLGRDVLLKARIDLDAEVSGFDPDALEGSARLALSGGRLDRAQFQKLYGIALPDTAVEASADARLQGTTITYGAVLRSAAAVLTSKGSVVPANTSVDLRYDLAVTELGLFAALTPIPLHGPLHLDGTARGDAKALLVEGNTDLFKGRGAYRVNLRDFAPASLRATLTQARTEALLAMVGRDPLIHGAFDFEADLANLDPAHLEGTAKLKLVQGSLDAALLKRDYALSLPDTAFLAEANALLKGENVSYDLNIRSALAAIGSSGKIVPKTSAMDLSYDLSVGELAALEGITPIPMRGSLATKGRLKGDAARLELTGESDLAKSRTRYEARLEDFAPRSVKASVKGARVEALLYMLGQNHYADGQVDLEAEIPDARVGSLDGTVRVDVTQGVVDGETFSKQFDFKPMPRTTFSALSTTTLAKKGATTRTRIQSTLADVTSDNAAVDFETGYVHADYRVDVPDLNKLYFITDRPLKGGVVLTGTLAKTKDLDVTTHSDTLGGTVDVTMHNDDIHGEFAGIQTLEALKMLTYPEVFRSKMKGIFDYNVLKESGSFKADLGEGTFTSNVMLDLLKQLAKTDLYKERFTGDAKGTIVKEKVTADLALRANTSSITSKNLRFDTKSRRIDAKVDVVANKNPLAVTLKGSIDSPNVNVDVSKLAEQEAKKALQKEATKLFKKLF